MNIFFILLFSFSMLFATYGYSESALTDMFDGTYDEHLQEEAFPLDKKLIKKYQTVAKSFSKSSNIETNIITYETLETGVNVHIGWYSDGYIVTALDGTQAGKQIVVINNDVVAISYDIKVYNGYFIHNYLNFKVISYPNKQFLKNK